MFHDCLELSMKSARRVILGVVERSWEGSELMESGGGLGGGRAPHWVPLCRRRPDGERVEEMTTSSCSQNWEWVGFESLSGPVRAGWTWGSPWREPRHSKEPSPWKFKILPATSSSSTWGQAYELSQVISKDLLRLSFFYQWEAMHHS